jgi:hypothetical protein
MLDGKLPQIPHGVFENAKTNMEDGVTWQPRAGVRMALVVESVSSSQNIGYVAVGRSLQEVEVRESNLVKMILMVWVACIGVILMHFVIQLWFASRENRNKQLA